MLSLHSHSGQYCAHASGTLRSVVERAVALGFRVYGLSEHMPRSRPEDLYPDEIEKSWGHQETSARYAAFLAEVLLAENAEFTNHREQQARTLQAEFSDRIELLVGMETEHIHASTLRDASEMHEQLSLDYLVGSVHHVNEIPIDYDETMYASAEARAFELAVTSDANAAASCSPTECLFRQYFDAQHEMLVALQPHVVGHFDLVAIFRKDHPLSEDSWKRIKRNVDVIVSYGGIVEINSRAWKKGLQFAYPQKSIVEYMISRGVRFCLSDDSHGPNDVGMHYARLFEYIKLLGITTVYYPLVSLSKDKMDRGVKDSVLPCKSIENVINLPFWDQFLK